VSAFDGLPQALRTLCVRDGRALQDIAQASRISPAMLSSYLTGRESPTLKTLDKLLDGLKLRLEDLAGALEEVQGHGRRRRARSAKEDLVLGHPRPEVEKFFVEQLARLGLVPRRKAKKPASPRDKPRKPGKA
jgi:transcriptional regulator with XRE-family HTH domain